MAVGPDSTSTDRAQLTPRLPKEVWVLVGVTFVIAVGFGVVAPALPTFARSFDVSVTAAAIVVSAFAFMRLAFAPASGRLVSRFGERPIFIHGILIVALSTGACALAQEYWQLLVLRAVGGIGSTMFTVSAVALLIRLTPPPLRGRATGLWATSFLLGSVTGPLFGGALIAISLRAPFVTYAAALFAAAAVAWVFLRRSVLAGAVTGGDEPELTVRQALGHGAYRAALLSNFATGWAVFGVRVSLVPLFVVEVLNRPGSLAGVALSAFAVGNVATLMLAGKIADSIGRRPPMLAGLVIAGGATIWLGFTEGVAQFMVATVVAGLGTGMVTPPQGAAVADVIGSKAKGGPVLAAFQMAADIGAIIGPIAGGVLADHLSYTSAFVLTGTMALVAAMLWFRAPETLPRGADAQRPDRPERAVPGEVPLDAERG